MDKSVRKRESENLRIDESYRLGWVSPDAQWWVQWTLTHADSPAFVHSRLVKTCQFAYTVFRVYNKRGWHTRNEGILNCLAKAISHEIRYLKPFKREYRNLDGKVCSELILRSSVRHRFRGRCTIELAYGKRPRSYRALILLAIQAPGIWRKLCSICPFSSW